MVVQVQEQLDVFLNLAAGYVRTTHTATPPDITPGHIATLGGMANKGFFDVKLSFIFTNLNNPSFYLCGG